MRRVNTLRITAHCRTQAEADELSTYFERLTRVQPECTVLTHAEFPTIYQVKLWLKRQPDIKAVLGVMKTLTDQDVHLLREQAPLRIDERGNFFFRLDKQAFMQGHAILVEKGDVLQFRLNMAAHPKTTQTVLETIAALLSDINL